MKKLFVLSLIFAISLSFISCGSGSSQTVYVDKIEILENDGYVYHDLTETDEKGNEIKGKYVIIPPDENGEYKYQIRYTVSPDNATNKKAVFLVDVNKTESDFTVDENGLVTIFGKGKMAKIFVEAVDGGTAKDLIIVISQ